MSRVSLIEQLYAPKKKSALEFNYDALWAPPIRFFLSQQDINELYKIATSLKYNDNIEKKYELIDAVMKPRGFKRGNCGTNRVVYNFLEDTSFCMKIALDRVGINDSPREYKNQEFFKPFCCKIFEVDPTGVIACVERVNPISSLEEFLSVSDDVFSMMITKIIGKYVVDDLGTEKYLNYGIRYNSNGFAFGPVILDYPYAYELDGAKLRCGKPIQIGNREFACGGEIDYDNGLNNLVCCKCGRHYSARELAKDDSNILKFYSDNNEQRRMRARIVRESDGTIIKDSGRSSKVYMTKEEYEEGNKLFELKDLGPRPVKKTIRNKYTPMKKLREQYYTELQVKAYEEMQKRNVEPFNPVIKSEFAPKPAARAKNNDVIKNENIIQGSEKSPYTNNEFIRLDDDYEIPRVRRARRAEDVLSETSTKLDEETLNPSLVSNESCTELTTEVEETVTEESNEEPDNNVTENVERTYIPDSVKEILDSKDVESNENDPKLEESTESKIRITATVVLNDNNEIGKVVDTKVENVPTEDAIYDHDENGNLIHYKDSSSEYWNTYDENGNCIYYKDSDGYEVWHEYDENNNEIHCKDSKGYEEWFEYDEDGNLISSSDNESKSEEPDTFSEEMEADVFPEISNQGMIVGVNAPVENDVDYSNYEPTPEEDSSEYHDSRYPDSEYDYKVLYSNRKENKRNNKKSQKLRTKKYSDDMSDY